MSRNGDTQMERAEAARALLVEARGHDSRDQSEEEVAAFMAIFHPDRVLPEGGRYTEEKR